MAVGLPKIAPDVLERTRVQKWLEFHAKTAMRYICAPAGSGKTTSAVRYARGRAIEAPFITLARGSDAAALIAQFVQRIGLATSNNYAELVERIAAAAPGEIIVDGVDKASVDARQLLGRIYLDVPDSVTFVYLARSEDALIIGDGRARGLVDICDPALFAFDIHEIACFAESLGLQENALSYARLLEGTHGWAIAVSGVCRAAAANGLRLSEASRYWHRLNDTAIREVIDDALRTVSPCIAREFSEILARQIAPAHRSLESFRAAGLFVIEWNGRLAINPLVYHGSDTSDLVRPATVKMFGRFDMSVDGRSIVWIRRRDSEIIQFLAVQPHGRATRSGVIANFWPDADPQLARQSLRSSCSTIRRAISECVGRANVGRYFVADHVLELVFENAVVTTREFVQQCDLAESAYARNDARAALTHFQKAAGLYRSPLLAGEAPAAWSIPYVVQFAAMRADAAAKCNQLADQLRAG